MSDYTIADVSYDGDEMEQFLLFWDSGEPETRRATPENILLFDPEDDLPFEGGLRDFLNGEDALRLADSPEIVVSQSGDGKSYLISVNGSTIETTPKQASDVLRAIKTALVDDSLEAVKSLHQSVLKEQVRRPIVNALRLTFPESSRITVTQSGWLVDGFYLVDWNAKLYASNDDPDSADYVRSGGKAVEKDTSYELVQLRHRLDEVGTETVTIDGSQYTLTEREMMFLARVTWLLDRRYYHPDDDFWNFCDQWASVESSEPDTDVFTL